MNPVSSLLPRLTSQMVITVFQKPIGQVHPNQQFATTTKLPSYVNYDYGSEESTQSLQGNTAKESLSGGNVPTVLSHRGWTPSNGQNTGLFPRIHFNWPS